MTMAGVTWTNVRLRQRDHDRVRYHADGHPFSFSLALSRFDDAIRRLFRWFYRPPFGGLLSDPAAGMPSLPGFQYTH